jgi:alpha-galactosidase
MNKRITIIGAGSSMFTPQLISLLVQSKTLQGSTVALMDINPHRLELMSKLSRMLIEQTGADLKIEATTDRVEALTGADFVIVAISVGGFDAWEKDIEIPAKYGIFVPYGDSVGPGGMLRAFRHVLPMVQICKDMERVAPKAWMFNYTNPASTLCWAMRKESTARTVSMCTNTVPLRNEKFMANLVGAKPGDMVLPAKVAGINHCSAITELRLKDGTDGLELVRKKTRHPIVKWALETHGVLPIVFQHWVEFYPMLCKLAAEYKGRAQGLFLTYGSQVKDMQLETGRIRTWEKLVGQWVAGEGKASIDAIPDTEPVQLIEVMEAMVEDRKEFHGVNVPNHGAIENLPDDAVVEVMALIGTDTVQPLQSGRLPDEIASFLKIHIDTQKLTAEAALKGDRKIALQAFELDPFISGKLELKQVPQMLDEMLLAHAKDLPQFN